MEEEQWLPVQGFEDLYHISNHGRIMSFHRGIYVKSMVKGERGYPTCILYKNKKYKQCYNHRLVAIHFIPNPLNLKEVNHKDGDRMNCHWSNLEWVTPSENVQHSYTFFKRLGPTAIFTREQVFEILSYSGPNPGKYLSEKFSCHYNSIYQIRRGISYKSWRKEFEEEGFIFKNRNHNILDLWRSGLNSTQLAESFDLSRRTITDILKYYREHEKDSRQKIRI